jgi:hypothetical protein
MVSNAEAHQTQKQAIGDSTGVAKTGQPVCELGPGVLSAVSVASAPQQASRQSFIHCPRPCTCVLDRYKNTPSLLNCHTDTEAYPRKRLGEECIEYSLAALCTGLVFEVERRFVKQKAVMSVRLVLVRRNSCGMRCWNGVRSSLWLLGHHRVFVASQSVGVEFEGLAHEFGDAVENC